MMRWLLIGLSASKTGVTFFRALVGTAHRYYGNVPDGWFAHGGWSDAVSDRIALYIFPW
jgi:hypothetical protein